MPERHPNPETWTLDEWIVGVLITGGVAVLLKKLSTNTSTVAARLQDHGILLPPGRGLIDLPHLGALDVGRVLIVAGVVAAVVGVWTLLLWRRGPRGGVGGQA